MTTDEREWADEHQKFEAAFWNDCANSFAEELKQLTYARLMGLDPGPWYGGIPWPSYDMEGKSVLDVGGGPASMLLKCVNLGLALVVDPCPYPDWTLARYEAHGVTVDRTPAEDFESAHRFDEVLGYNVLQHTKDPERIVRRMCEIAETVRIFEWIDVAPHPGHPHELTRDKLNEWVGAEGTVVTLDEWYRPIDEFRPMPGVNRVEQKAWGGVFPGRR